MFDSDGVGQLHQVLVHAAGDTLSAAARLDPGDLDDATLRGVIVGLERSRRRLDAAEAHLLAELHDRSATEDAEGLATSRWLAREAALPAGAARQRVRTATKLRDTLTEVDDALTDGRIGFDHARVLAEATNERNAEAMAAASATLCDLAASSAFGRWRRDVHALAALADPDGGHDPDDLTRNQLHLSPTDGLVMFTGELTGDHALTFHHTLEARADELFHRYKAEREQFPDQQIPARSTLRALALVELCRHAQGVDPDTTRAPRTDATIVIHACDPSAGAAVTATSDPATPAELVLGGWLDSQPIVAGPDGRRLDATSAATLICSAVFRVLHVTADGVPISETPTYRPTRSQRRALAHRDGGCVFPGCGATHGWTDAHHLQHWPTGPTTLPNLVSLCRHHHRIAHRHSWTLELTHDGWTRWTNPTGTTRWGQRHHRQRAGPET
jgi:hypothetical protein